MLEKQRQEAGDNSQQIQAGTVIINGINEKRAREIVDEKLHKVIAGFTQEVHIIAKERIDLFSNDFIPRLVKNNLLEELKEAKLPNDILCDHELRPGFARLRILGIDKLDLLTLTHQQEIIRRIDMLTDSQKESIKKIYALYNSNAELKSQNVSKFVEKWDEYYNLKNLRAWWNAIPVSYTITPVDSVLAHANAQRCDSTFPSLN